MASGYIGKISAVVTANTSDLTKKLADAGNDTKRFSENLNRSISSAANSATNSLQKIFTPLQKIERRLQTSLKIPGLDLPLDKIRAAVSLTEQINKPLAKAASGFSGLSLDVQGAFLPALQKVQDQAVSLNLQLENTGKVSERSFSQAQRSVEGLIAAQNRLQQAQSLSAQSLSGNELQFSNPLLFQTLNASAATTRKAAALPATSLADGTIAKSVQALKQYQQAAIQAQGTLESLRLDPQIDPRIVRDQERRLASLTETARRAQEQLQRVVEVQGNIGASTPFMSTRDPQGRSITERLQSNILGEQLRDENRLVSAQQELGRKIGNGFLTILTPAEAAADTVVSRQQELGRKIANGFLTVITAEEAAADTIASRQQELGRKIANGFLTVITAEEAAADTIASRQQALGRKIANGFLNVLTPAEAAADTIEGRRRSRSAAFVGSFGGGAEGLSASFDERAIRGYSAQLQVLQAAISKVSSEARGPAYTAFLKLRDAIADAMNRGELETEQTRQELKGLTTDAVNATAAVTGIGARGLGRSVARAGDIGRAGFDKFSLAANQAAFAIDDFLSATGGIEFRIRAVQNNLTQLAFILGGTTGLFIGLGVAIGAQAAIALSQFISEGRKAEDVLKALNDSLARQKSLAEGLADALSEASGEATGGVFSEAARSADELSARLEKIEESFKRIREERIAASNVDLQQSQATANSIERRLSNEQDVGVRIVLQSELSRLRDEIASATSQAQTPRSLQENIQRFRDATLPLEQRRIIRGNLANRRITSQEASQQIETLLSGVSSESDLRRLLQERISATQPLVNTSEGVSRFFRNASSDTAAREIAALQEILTSLEDFSAASDAVSGFVEDATKIGAALSRSRSLIEDFGDGIASAGEYSSRLDEAGKSLQRAVDAVTEAQKTATGSGGSPEDLTKAIADAVAEFNTEAEARSRLVNEIESAFNEEAANRRKAAREIVEAAQKRKDEERRALAEERRRSSERGRELLQTDREARVEQLTQSIIDIENALNAAANVDNARQARRATNQFLDAEFSRQAAQVAPGLISLQASVNAAVAAGPSRQALNAADITTQQGTAELNRLLRGDDSARDQNLLELQKQTAELVGLRQDFNALRVAD